ncbi:MAG: MAPEG family protein [Rhizobiales bacterium]|nr:MAPEG family protein [Hyphomicrobiales bacterium]
MNPAGEAVSLSIELRYLIYVSLWLVILWVPYVLAHIVTVGPVKAFGYSDEPMAMPLWAQRLKRAHYNLVENIVPFAVAVGAGEILNVHTQTTATCALVFVIARVAHPFTQVLAIWGTRTLAFAAGWLALVIYLFAIMGWV